ncbi:246_t:CDS:2, partial [Diversispora eburnea]
NVDTDNARHQISFENTEISETGGSGKISSEISILNKPEVSNSEKLLETEKNIATMGWSKIISPCSRAREFSEDLFADNNKLFCKFCNISIGWQNKATITTHINSKAHKDSCRSYVAANRNDRQQSLHATMVVADRRKQIIYDLGGSISLADSIRKHHLSDIFEQHYEQLCGIFCGKPVSIIIDETTDKKTHSVINTLFSYQGQTKLISIDFISQVNNVTVDLTAYMKKSIREILQPVMPQIQHNTYYISTNSDNSLNSQDTQQLTLRFMPLPNTTR